MKFLIEVSKKKTNVTDIYRKILSRKAKAVKLVKDDEDIIICEVWFESDELFKELVNIVFDVDFNKVVLINDSGDNKDEGEEKKQDVIQVDMPQDLGAPVENTPPKVDVAPVPSNIPNPDKLVEGKKDVSEEEILGEEKGTGVNENGGVIVETPFAEHPIPDKGTGVANSKKDETLKENKTPAKPGLKPGGKQRKREGAELSNLFVIPEFQKEFTLENIVAFFEPMKDRVREAVTDVVNVALDVSQECSMDWKDVVRVSELKGKYLSDYDKTLSAKRIADVFEQHGYSIRFRAFLQLLRAHVDGSIPRPIKQEIDVDKVESKGRIKCLNYPQELEKVYEDMWNSGASLDEILVCIFNFMAVEELPDTHVKYLTVCAEDSDFSDLDSIHIGMENTVTQAKVIQGELATILEDYSLANNLPQVRLFEFLKEIKDVFEEEA